MNYMLYVLLEQAKKVEEDPWYLKVLKEIGKQIVDLAKDFRDFFLLIKEHTYDVLVQKFGYVGVTLVFIVIFIILIMIIVTRIIRGKDN